MITARTAGALRQAVADARTQRADRIGFVPTMGYLHEGHLSLIDEARRHGANFVVVSVFVNPTQFGPNEDLSTYPRDEKRDARLLAERGTDLLFLPAVETIYPGGFSTTVSVRGVAETLEGEARPGHFDGVATVVLKLLNVVRPDIAIFGRKDAQQCEVIRRMAIDLDLPVQLVFGDTVRESDGLAMSSRNAYLSTEDRALAPRFHEALRAGAAILESGARSTETVERAMHDYLQRWKGIDVEYLRLVDPETFHSPSGFDRDLLLVGAVRIGRTRLIDNIRIERPSPGGRRKSN
jgi:pantoate--beta-alanine ligase